MLLIFYFFIFLFGLIVGSFLNCAIYRLEVGKSFTRGRSFCPKCKHTLGFWDLVPVASFVALQGKCRYCGEKISWQYPIVEIITGLSFLLIFNFQFSIFKQFSISQFSNFQDLAQWLSVHSIDLIYLLSIFCLLEVVFIYDLKHFIIPDKVLWPAILLTASFRGLEFLFNELQKRDIGISAVGLSLPWIAGLGAAGLFFLIWAVSRGKWMGFGDVKLALFMGLFLGWPAILPALFFSFAFGAIIGVILMALKKKGMKSEVPFGPFLIAGTMVGLFWGEQVVRWYMQFVNF